MTQKLVQTIRTGGRLCVEMPPRHGKSELIGKYLPAWFLGTYPDRNVMYCSYETHQAELFGEKARTVFREWGEECFGLGIDPSSRSKANWRIDGHSGGMFTAGVGGALTGKGAHMLIIDDPVKNADEAVSEVMRDKTWEWWLSTASTRIEPGGCAIIVQTRWHNDDLAGRVQRHANEGKRHWDVLRFPAIAEEADILGRQEGDALWPYRYPIEELRKIEADESPYWWNSLYQQRPSQHESVEWPAEYFEDSIYYDDEPPDSSIIIKSMALDPSKGRQDKPGDYTAFAMLKVDRSLGLWVDMDMGRRPIEDMVQHGCRLYKGFMPDLFAIESNAWQELLNKDFTRELAKYGLHWVEPIPLENRVKKIVRIRELGQFLRNRKLRVKRNAGGKLLVSQMREFPLAAHDDGPDALQMAIRIADEGLVPVESSESIDFGF